MTALPISLRNAVFCCQSVFNNVSPGDDIDKSLSGFSGETGKG